MPAPAPALPPVAYQVAAISTALNGGLVLTFLMGIYTTVYFGTVYLYATRKTSQTRVVTATITMLYLLNVALLAIQWRLLQSGFVDSGETRERIFIKTFTTRWAALASQSCTAASNIVADGLLIWRGFYAWDRSLLAISLPLFFLVAETGLYMSSVIFFSVVKSTPSNSQAMILNSLAASGYFLSLASTISSTLLIVYRIYNSVSHQGTHYKKRFMHIMDVVVQSAAVYSLALVVVAIAMVVVVTSGGHRTSSLFAVLCYEGCPILIFFSGIAPTIMVARVALATDNTVVMNSSNVYISGLQFQGRSGIGSTDINGGKSNAVAIGHSSRELEKQTV